MNHWHSIPITQIHREIVRWNSQQPITTETLPVPVPRKLRACCTIHNEATQGAIPAIYQISHEIVMHTAMTFPLIQTMSASFLNENIPTATDGLSNSLFHSQF